MNFDDTEKQNELIDLIAQAVIDKMEQREQVNHLAETVFQRVIALKHEEEQLHNSATQKGATD